LLGTGATLTPTPVEYGTSVTRVAGSESEICFDHNGEVLCYGRWKVFTDIGFEPGQPAAGTNHACALPASGNVYCWGDNAHGQLGNGSRDPGYWPSTVALPGKAVSLAAGAL